MPMHYYKFNIADYRKDTAHLSRIEHSIYRDLIDWYYLDEKPIPLDTQLVSRRLRLGTDEVSFLLSVLTDFFVETTEGYQHRRIESEIEAYHAKVNTNRENGKKGGRQRATETENNPAGCESEPNPNPNQEPLTTNQEPTNTDTAAPSESGKPDPCPHQAIVDLYHEVLPQLARVRDITEKRKTALRARWRQNQRFQNLDWWRKYFSAVAVDDFLMGRLPGRQWQADFDFLLRPDKFQKIIEGGYQRGGE